MWGWSYNSVEYLPSICRILGPVPKATHKKAVFCIVLLTSFDAVVITFIYFVDRGMWECTWKSHVMDMEVVSQLVAISSFLLLCELKD